MTNPAFVPTSPALTVRYHTALDPYHFTIDNRPLSDLDANLQTLGTQAIDGTRRAGLIAQSSIGKILEDMFDVGTTNYVHGLRVGYSAGNLSIYGGTWLALDALYTGATVNTAKQYVKLITDIFAITAPGTAGQSIDYLIQAELKSLATGTASNIPYFDITNTYLPSSTLTGEIFLSIKAGTAAATGSQVTPTADVGKTPLYKVTFTNGAAAPVVQFASGAPAARKLQHTVQYVDNTTAPASFTGINGMGIPRFLNGVPSSISFAVSAKNPNLCPYLPLKLRLSLASTVGSGDVALKLTTLGYGAGTLTTATGVDTTQVVTMSATPNMVVSTSTTMVAAVNQFAGFSAGNWGPNVDSIVFQLTRLGGDVADTNTGDLDLVSLEVIQ